jgi:hypothetical protein
VNGKEYVAFALGGSATTAAQHLGAVGATVLVLTLGGKPVTPIPSPGLTSAG